MVLPGHGVASGMRAKEILFILCPLTPPIPLLAGRGTCRSTMRRESTCSKNLTEKFSQEVYLSLTTNSQISLKGLNHGEVISIW